MISLYFYIFLFSFVSCSIRLNVSDYLTLSGISGGGYMAVQFLFSHSSSVMGAGIVAGGPYYCSEEFYLTYALTTCMSDPEDIDLEVLVNDAKQFESMGIIDNLENLRNADLFLFSGTKDTVVHQGVMKKLEKMLSEYFEVNNITVNYSIPSEHSMVTDYYGNDCGHLGSPYINNCGFDLAGEILKKTNFDKKGSHFSPRADKINEQNIFKFPQDDVILISMNDFGLSYIPTTCQNGELCSLHVDFHGCNQYYDTIGAEYVKYSGYARWAENNNIIIISPQTAQNVLLNPHGCFDWWGYSGIYDYAVKVGEQIAATKGWIEKFQNGTIKLSKYKMLG